MKADGFPYKKFEKSQVWTAVEKAIDDLVQNTDLIEQTDRRYVVGYLINRMQEEGVLTKQSVQKIIPKKSSRGT
jgi:hypothetical protein